MSEDLKKSAKALFENGLNAFERGNHREAGRVFKQILASNPSLDIKEKSEQMLKKLGFDWMQLVLGGVALLLLACLYVYFGFIK